jgi:hypothetical protein
MEAKMHIRRLFSATIVLLLATAVVWATNVPGATVKLNIPRVKQAPKLEQFVSNSPREAEAVVTNFIQREPHDGDSASQPTTAYLSYDDKNLYVVFYCKDDPKLIRAHLGKRENLDGDDWVAIIVDTFHDHTRAYELFVNPYGVQMDGVAAENQNDDYNWDTIYDTQARIVEDGWIGMMTIPFRSLRFKNTPIQEWGFMLARSINRKDEISFYPPMTRKIAGFANQMGHLDGMESISPGRNMQFIPYFSMAASRSMDLNQPGGAQYRTDYEPRSGLDSKIIIKDALTLDVTINPDFSQVESDEPQVTLNQRYEVFFPEKRPFFLENSDFFTTPENLFFSRRIVDPEYGARLTGKLHGWSIGALTLDDRAAGSDLPSDDPAYNQRAKIGLGRVRREFKNSSNVGAMYTDREFAGSYNRLFSMDSMWRLDKHWTLTSQAIGSFDRDLSGVDRTGSGYNLNIERSGRDLIYWTNYTERSPDLRTTLGYIPRTDIRQVSSRMGYVKHTKASKVLSFGPILYYLMTWDHQGRMPRNSQLGLERTEVYELFQGLDFRQHRTHLYAQTSWLKWLQVDGAWHFGTGVDYYPKSGPPTLSNWNLATANAVFRINKKVQFSQGYIYDRLATLEGVPIYNNHMLRSKLNYQFSPRLSVRTIVDYRAVLGNSNLYNGDTDKHLLADVLLTYMVHPGTALYVGYTDNYQNMVLDPSGPNGWRRSQNPTLNTGRQFFVKLSYLLRF